MFASLTYFLFILLPVYCTLLEWLRKKASNSLFWLVYFPFKYVTHPLLWKRNFYQTHLFILFQMKLEKRCFYLKMLNYNNYNKHRQKNLNRGRWSTNRWTTIKILLTCSCLHPQTLEFPTLGHFCNRSSCGGTRARVSVQADTAGATAWRCVYGLMKLYHESLSTLDHVVCV